MKYPRIGYGKYVCAKTVSLGSDEIGRLIIFFCKANAGYVPKEWESGLRYYFMVQYCCYRGTYNMGAGNNRKIDASLVMRHQKKRLPTLLSETSSHSYTVIC